MIDFSFGFVTQKSSRLLSMVGENHGLGSISVDFRALAHEWQIVFNPAFSSQVMAIHIAQVTPPMTDRKYSLARRSEIPRQFLFKRFGNPGNSRITRIAPGINALADLIHQWQGDKFPAVLIRLDDDLR